MIGTKQIKNYCFHEYFPNDLLEHNPEENKGALTSVISNEHKPYSYKSKWRRGEETERREIGVRGDTLHSDNVSEVLCFPFPCTFICMHVCMCVSTCGCQYMCASSPKIDVRNHPPLFSHLSL